MLRYLFFIIGVMIIFGGCTSSAVNVSSKNSSNSELSKKLLAQKEKSDKEVQKLEQEIAKLEADKEKYQQDFETFDNNPILNELDETLKDEDKSEEDLKKDKI